MPWKEIRPVDQRKQFIGMYVDERKDMSELCRTFGISRKTGYKWLDRYAEEGMSGLSDRSRAPHRVNHKTSEEAVEYIVEQRGKHPTWGAEKITQKASIEKPKLKLPSHTTMDRIIREHGLSNPKGRRTKHGHPGKPLVKSQGPNDIWTTDFKGEFRTLDGVYCYPLTILDEYSRLLLACQGLFSTGYEGAFPVFKRVFREFGLPRAIKSDNGVPFATTGLARLSKLSVWWIKLGVEPVLIEPASPSQNGTHERMHRTLKKEATIPPCGDMAAQQRRFNEWRQEYNHERPHAALGGKYPGDYYRPSLRELPNRLPDVVYPSHYEVRYVSANHGFRWNHHWVMASSALVGENVGLTEVSDGLWAVYFFWKRIGFLCERKMRILDDLGQWTRKEL